MKGLREQKRRISPDLLHHFAAPARGGLISRAPICASFHSPPAQPKNEKVLKNQ
jgi:hypothetical protein